jgi:hypothetical protein
MLARVRTARFSGPGDDSVPGLLLVGHSPIPAGLAVPSASTVETATPMKSAPAVETTFAAKCAVAAKSADTASAIETAIPKRREAPAEWAVEGAGTHKGVIKKVGIPIPTG